MAEGYRTPTLGWLGSMGTTAPAGADGFIAPWPVFFAMAGVGGGAPPVVTVDDWTTRMRRRRWVDGR